MKLKLVSRESVVDRAALIAWLKNCDFIAIKASKPLEPAYEDLADVMARCHLKEVMTRSNSYKFADMNIAFFKIGQYIVIGPKDPNPQPRPQYVDHNGNKNINGPAGTTCEALEVTLTRILKNAQTGPPTGVKTHTGGSMKNDDGVPMYYGTMAYAQTLYCGQKKKTEDGTFLKACFSARGVTGMGKGIYPPDSTCGPSDGLQCNACKIVQDSMDISKVTISKCPETFLKLFTERFDTMLVEQIREKNSPDTTKFSTEVCKGGLNSNQSTKIVFATAIEMLREWCGEHTNFKMCGIYDTDINADKSSCDVKMSYSAPVVSPQYKPVMRGVKHPSTEDSSGLYRWTLHIESVYVKHDVLHQEPAHAGWDHSYVECSFQVLLDS
jgi:hypothetical protein